MLTHLPLTLAEKLSVTVLMVQKMAVRPTLLHREPRNFTLLPDTLPASFGGEGTDILANLTGIRFLDKDFQLSPVIESFQGPEGAEQMTMGTTFDDYIDLTGGNAAQTSTTITSCDSATSIPVASTDGLPMSGYIKIGSEEIYYRDITRDTLDATGGRGANGTSAGSHSNGATATVDGRNQVEPGKGNDFIRVRRKGLYSRLYR